MSKVPSIYAIVLNWNQEELTTACLNSLARSDYPRFKVIVVDNGSTHGSPDYFRREFPWVDVLTNERNLGFAGGNNVGIRYVLARGADLVWLLNNDTEVAPDCVLELARASMAHPEYALFAPKIYYYDPPQMLWYAGGEIRLDRPMGVTHIGMGMIDDGNFDHETEISFVTGCAFLIRGEAINAIGLLDEDMFIYNEDMDWSIRAQRRGYRGLYVPDARLWHKVSQVYGTQKGQRVKTYLFARNRFIVQKRYSSTLKVLSLIPKYQVSSAARRAYRALATGDPY